MERDEKDFKCGVYLTISTHTLTWSVTATKCEGVDLNSNFNSHAHVERDNVSHVWHFLFSISTHTLTWSVTIGKGEAKLSFDISTHTLTWSVTDEYIASKAPDAISTHTLTWSVTVLFAPRRTDRRFQLTRSRGA